LSLRKLTAVLALVTLVISMLATTTPALAALYIEGHVTDKATGAPLRNICVTLGPPITCFGGFGGNPGLHTDATGYYKIDLDALAASPGGTWDMYFLCDAICKTVYPQSYNTEYSGKFVVSGPVVKDIQMTSAGTPPPPPPPTCVALRTDAPTQTVYLPNITRRLGGANGWYTPFIIQNTGAASTALEVSFYMFTDGSCVSRLNIPALNAGTSYSNDPNDNGKNPSLPNDAQFSVVVRSFGSSIVGIVNEHQGTGSAAEAMSYDGFTSGATTVYLPNMTRRFFGFVTPFIIQNLGGAATIATATFRPFDGSSGPITVTRSIDAGRAKPIDPNSNDFNLGAPGLQDGKQYSVTVQSPQPVAVVVNTQNDAPGTATPMAASTDGVTAGAATVYGSYAAKNASGRRTPIIVQNLGGTAVTPTITFTPLAGGFGTANTYTFPSIAAQSSKAFDPRFSFDTQGTTNVLCNGHSATCLGDGEYAFKVDGGAGSSLAVQVNPESASTLMAYAGTSAPATKYFLPNVTKSLCFCPTPVNGVGWTTPLLIQSVTATGVTLQWYRFSDGSLVTTQTLTLTAGSGVRVDPWSVSALAADAQYSVVATATGGTMTAIVTEFAPGGDNAMAYEGFAAP
jgi:hypothetical protein